MSNGTNNVSSMVRTVMTSRITNVNNQSRCTQSSGIQSKPVLVVMPFAFAPGSMCMNEQFVSVASGIRGARDLEVVDPRRAERARVVGH